MEVAGLFYVNQLAVLSVLSNLLTSYFLGLLVQSKKMPVFISRKIIHISFFFLPFLLRQILPSSEFRNFFWSLGLLTILRYSLYLEPLRNRSKILQTCFSSVDRDDDRPFTLQLLYIQRLGQLLVIGVLNYFNAKYFQPTYMSTIAYLTLTFGDGLAEPVGKLVKSKKYKVFSIFNTRENYRTLAGSLCVYIVCFTLILIYYPTNSIDYYFQLLIVPFLAALIEGASPKSLDNPFIYLGVFESQKLISMLFTQV